MEILNFSLWNNQYLEVPFYLLNIPEVDLEGVSRFFCHHLFFCNHFEELQTVLVQVKLIINNAPLTCIYLDTVFNTQSFVVRHCLYYSNTTSTVVRNLIVLSSTTDKINRISNRFLDRWRHEHAVNLLETQRTSKLNINSPKIMLS